MEYLHVAFLAAVFAVPAVAIWWGLLRLMDVVAGVPFKHKLRAGMSVGDGVYYGGRALAAAAIVGLALLR